MMRDETRDRHAGSADAVGEARMGLAGVYGWFTEGFDTPDLQDTHALSGTPARC
jgi:hypothetical protein